MDEDVYLNAVSASAVKTTYESNADTNAFTDALLSKLDGIEENAKDDQSADEVLYDATGQTYATGSDVQAAIYAIDDELLVQDGRLDTAESDITAVEGRLDTIEGDVNTAGSVAKALQDAKDYADTQDALQDAADEISYDATGQTYATGTDVQAAIYAIDDELIAQNTKIETIQGDNTTDGSIAKALKDAKDYADAQDALQDEADEITYDNTDSLLTATDVQAALDEIVANYEPADATILKSADIGVTVQGYDANTLKSGDIGVSVQGYDANTVVDANYETFDSTASYANLRAQATTAEDVGLENVTNESKATMFADPTFTGTVTIGSGASLTGVPDPTNTTDAANKRYVDELVEGLKTAPAVHAATTGNLSGTYDNGTAGVGATLNLGVAATLTIDGESV